MIESMQILVVDDESAMLRSIVRLLEGRYGVTPAESGEVALEVALEVASNQSLDLAILDVRMPGMDGFELAERLRAAHPGIDVILMTGEAHEVDTQVVRAIRDGAFYFVQKPFDREVLLTLVARCLELRRLARENASHLARLEAELSDARKFQLSILPPARLRSDELELDACYTPCTELGGDFYDYARTSAGALAFLVADVSGHGTTAAMLTATLKSAFQGTLASDFAPDVVVRAMAEAMRSFDVGRFVTLFAGCIDAEGQLSYVNAGHPAPILAGAGGMRRLKLTGPMVSPAFPDLSWGLERVRLEPGDRLWVYTDGLPEVRNEGGECFGEERVIRSVMDTLGEAEGVDKLLEDARKHAGERPFEDDITMVRVGRTHPHTAADGRR